MSRSIPDALQDWEKLPDSAGVRIPIVARLLGCSTATVWRGARLGTLPKPYKTGPKTTVWNVGALRAHLRTIQANTPS